MTEDMAVTVLVVGAGPSGLMAGLCLRRLGVDVLVIDSKQGPTQESRALVLQARSLEILDQLGIAEEAIAEAQRVTAVVPGQGGRSLGRVPIGSFGANVTPFPGLWVLEQSKTERLLLDAYLNAGGTVLWGHELRDVSRSEHGCTRARIRCGGVESTIHPRFLIGADGASSTVREISGIGFEGSTNTRHFYVIDALGVTGLEAAVNMRTAADDFLLTFPMKGAHHHRILGVLDEQHSDESATRSRLEDVFGVRYGKAEWFATYRVHHRVASRFRLGAVFLVGDAAHVHSPVGAQGMNTGLQDSHNLACKIAEVVSGAPESILDRYEAERRPVALRLIAFTERAFDVVTSTSRVARCIRARGIRVLAPAGIRLIPWLLGGRRLFGYLSQTRIRYPMPTRPAKDEVVGRRLPWTGTNYPALRDFSWQLHGYGVDPRTLESVAHSLRVEAHAFSPDPHGRLRRDRLYLVRPDGFVAAASPTDSRTAIDRLTTALEV